MDPYRRAEACEAVPMWLRRPDGFLVPLDQGVERVAGRHPACDIVIEHSSVSPRHAGLTAGVARIVVRDLGSDNGTYVNGALAQGVTVVRIGESVSFGGAGAWIVEQGHDLGTIPRPTRAVRKKRVFMNAGNRGTLGDVGLVELLEAYEAARKSGVLELHAARHPSTVDQASIVLRQGTVYSVSVGGMTFHDPAAMKAAIDGICAWRHAEYELIRPSMPQR